MRAKKVEAVGLPLVVVVAAAVCRFVFFNVCLCFCVVELFFVFTTIEVVSKSGVAHKCKLFPFGFGANGRG